MTHYFYYKIYNVQGKKERGILEALSLQEAKEVLRQRGALVLSLEPRLKKPWFSPPKKRLKKTHLLSFTTQLAELLVANVPLYESLLSLEELWQGEPLYDVLHAITTDIKKGLSLSAALRRFPKFFPSLYISMIAAGEASGTVEKTLAQLAELLTRQHALQKKIVTTLIYPALLLAFSFLVIMVLLTFVVPSMEALFEDGNVKGFTKLVIGASHIVTRGWPWYLPALGITALGFFYFLKKNPGRFYTWLLSLPLIRKMLIEINIARFTKTLATLLGGGVNLREGLVLARGVMGFAPLMELMEEVERRIIEGSSLSAELKKSPLIPPLVPRMVAIGEEGGSMVTMLHRVGDFYEAEVEKKVARLLTLSGPVILLGMGTIVGIIMMAILLPLTDTSVFIGS